MDHFFYQASPLQRLRRYHGSHGFFPSRSNHGSRMPKSCKGRPLSYPRGASTNTGPTRLSTADDPRKKRGCEEINPHFFTAPFLWGIDLLGKGNGLFLLTVSMLRASSKDLRRLFPPLHTHLRRQRPCAGSGYRILFRRIRRGDGSSHRHRRPWY